MKNKLKLLMMLVLCAISGAVVAQNGEEIEIRKLSSSERVRICKDISSAASNIVLDHQFRLAAGYQVAEIAKAGNWEFTIQQADNSCIIIFDVQGSYEGNSYKKRVACGVRVVEKNSRGKYTAKWLAIGGGFDEGCRAS